MKSYTKTRLHIIARPKANVALVIVKKSKKATGFFKLDFANNSIIEGQWLQGKVYERRCDLSEKGKYILYFAAKFKRSIKTFTAISKFPFVKALDFYEKGDTYNGGGLFLSKNEYFLNETYAQKEIYKNSSFKVRRGKLNKVLLDDETDGVYYPRLIRDNWIDLGKLNGIRTFKKQNKNYEIVKECFVNGDLSVEKGIFYDINTFKSNGKAIMKIESDWMDFKNDKLYWDDRGKLFCANPNNIEDRKEIADLNDCQYKTIIVKY